MADNDNEEGAEQSAPSSRWKETKEWLFIIWLVGAAFGLGWSFHANMAQSRRQFYEKAILDADQGSNKEACALTALMDDMSRSQYQYCLDHPLGDDTAEPDPGAVIAPTPGKTKDGVTFT